jgi:hypothetical protein
MSNVMCDVQASKIPSCILVLVCSNLKDVV